MFWKRLRLMGFIALSGGTVFATTSTTSCDTLWSELATLVATTVVTSVIQSAFTGV
jgi:hypothetical protein